MVHPYDDDEEALDADDVLDVLLELGELELDDDKLLVLDDDIDVPLDVLLDSELVELDSVLVLDVESVLVLDSDDKVDCDDALLVLDTDELDELPDDVLLALDVLDDDMLVVELLLGELLELSSSIHRIDSSAGKWEAIVVKFNTAV